ncbi:MAG: hypothetical protein ACI8P9_003987 [Parasphingorhabdus sp.]|jgi:hypothetical protein
MSTNFLSTLEMSNLLSDNEIAVLKRRYGLLSDEQSSYDLWQFALY